MRCSVITMIKLLNYIDSVKPKVNFLLDQNVSKESGIMLHNELPPIITNVLMMAYAELYINFFYVLGTLHYVQRNNLTLYFMFEDWLDYWAEQWRGFPLEDDVWPDNLEITIETCSGYTPDTRMSTFTKFDVPHSWFNYNYSFINPLRYVFLYNPLCFANFFFHIISFFFEHITIWFKRGNRKQSYFNIWFKNVKKNSDWYWTWRN